MNWRKRRKKILRSNLFQVVAARVLYFALWIVYKTNKPQRCEDKDHRYIYKHSPAIFVLWHGQQLLAPFIVVPDKKLVAMVSRSADAEINARILKLAGYGVVRGSGGRLRKSNRYKGGASATLALKNALKTGCNVGIIADITKTTPRQAGRGIVSLAKISGRPIIPIAVATSRFTIIENSWDKTTINLPFGHYSVRMGDPVYVPADVLPEDMNKWRKQVDDELNRVTIEAYKAVGHDL